MKGLKCNDEDEDEDEGECDIGSKDMELDDIEGEDRESDYIEIEGGVRTD